MHLTPRESERLMVHSMGELAAKRKERGVKLNYVETIAYITADIYEKVRDGESSVLDLMEYGATLLSRDDVMEGVAEMLPALSTGGNVLHEIALEGEIGRLEVGIYLSTMAQEITDKGIQVKLPSGEEKFFDADTVIYATGQRPLWDEAKTLAACSPEFYQIGDCVAPKNIYAATQQAMHIARNLGRL